MNNDYIYRSFTKAELVQRCIDLGINRVAMLAERSRLRAELAACREALVDTKSALFAAEMRLAARKGEEGERDEHYDS